MAERKIQFTTNKGVFVAQMFEEKAPQTTKNFIELTEKGFYDGIIFHRGMDGFMIQGGDPTGTGRGGSSETIKGEFAVNGVKNPISHTRGVISMARNNISYDSASSQFFIVHQDSVFLDGQYAAFGHVTSGIEIVDAIAANTPVIDKNGTVPPEYQPVIVSVKIR